MLARAMASSSPSIVTRPSLTSVISYPMSYISFFSTLSMPKWQGTINSYWDISILRILVMFLALSVIIITVRAPLRKSEGHEKPAACTSCAMTYRLL